MPWSVSSPVDESKTAANVEERGPAEEEEDEEARPPTTPTYVQVRDVPTREVTEPLVRAVKRTAEEGMLPGKDTRRGALDDETLIVAVGPEEEEEEEEEEEGKLAEEEEEEEGPFAFASASLDFRFFADDDPLPVDDCSFGICKEPAAGEGERRLREKGEEGQRNIEWGEYTI